MSLLREFLMERYLLHGDREWEDNLVNMDIGAYINCQASKGSGFIIERPSDYNDEYLYHITPKGLEYLKNA